MYRCSDISSDYIHTNMFHCYDAKQYAVCNENDSRRLKIPCLKYDKDPLNPHKSKYYELPQVIDYTGFDVDDDKHFFWSNVLRTSIITFNG